MIPLLILLATQAKSDPWKTAFLPGGYSIQAPGPVKSMDKLTEMPPGTRGWMVLADAIYTVALDATVDLKEAPADQILAANVNEAVGKTGTLTGEKDLILNGWPGIEAEFVSDDAFHGRVRAYVVGSTVFMAGVQWEKDEPAANVTRFLGSMMTPDKAGRGPLKHAGPDFAEYKLEGTALTVRLPGKPEKSEYQIGTPDHPNKGIRFEADYGNRIFSCIYSDIPKDADEAGQVLADHEEEVRQQLNDEFMGAVPAAKERHDATYDFEGHKVLSSTAKVKQGFRVRIDSLLVDRRIYALISVCPQALSESDEIKGFFKSIKLDK
ncbi:MAG TPA: hypothetical protein VHE55_04955 [Fimbriimonadaceae bacterium]|nr:hypothetical protein [Fimbriimonadaceae bacterium]